MKFIFKKDTYRVPALKKITITEACKGATVESPHPNHLQQGGIFECGPWQDEMELRKAEDGPEKQLIAQLRVAGCVSDAADAECVARIEREIADRQRSEASASKANDQAKHRALQSAFVELIQRASALQAK